MNVKELDLPGVVILEPVRLHDERGFFSETFSIRELRRAGIRHDFVQDNHSLSKSAGVMRGLHFQYPPMTQAKLLRVPRGRVVDVVVDLRRGSPTYGRHAAIELSRENWRQLYVPPGFAHGFLTLEPNTEVLYKVSAYYAPGLEGGLMWNDPALDIAWPAVEGGVTLSEKDQRHPSFERFESPWIYGCAA